MAVVVTGARGFIGQNLMVRLAERQRDVRSLTASATDAEMDAALADASIVFHLAGVNRPHDPAEFNSGNIAFTGRLVEALSKTGSAASIVYSSSIQATLDNAYGLSKKAAEDLVIAHGDRGRGAWVYRLPNVFGKWARPNYNSAVATFCHNVSRGLDITVNDPAARLSLIYIDDVCDAFLTHIDQPASRGMFAEAEPVYQTSVGEVAGLIRGFAASRSTLMTDRVGTGLVRALYSTYVSCLDPQNFAYEVPRYSDPRGTFSEMLKTPDCGQFSYFTAAPGVTRGQHYHHTKTEKFLVLSGKARFCFRHLVSGELYEVVTSGGEGLIVETIPGWVHDITNIGEAEMVVMLWANEVFDRERPDTVAQKV